MSCTPYGFAPSARTRAASNEFKSALHTLKKSGEEVSNALSAGAAEVAQAMASGKTPARCIKTWSPIPYGREDYLFCLWEADSAQDVESTIRSFGFLEYFTLDAMQVDEIDWAQVAKAGGSSED